MRQQKSNESDFFFMELSDVHLSPPFTIGQTVQISTYNVTLIVTRYCTCHAPYMLHPSHPGAGDSRDKRGLHSFSFGNKTIDSEVLGCLYNHPGNPRTSFRTTSPNHRFATQSRVDDV